jgi:hypothetical protein
MAREIDTGLPPCIDSPLLCCIVKVEYYSGESKQRAGLANDIPTLLECYVCLDLVFKCFERELSTDNTAKISAEDRSAGDAEFGVAKVLQS